MSPRDRRALAAGAAVVGLALLVLGLVPSGWRVLSEERERLEARAGLLVQMRAQVGSTARLEDSGVVVKRHLATVVPRLLTGRTPTEAVTDLGARLAAAASHHRVRVTRTDPVSDSSGQEKLSQVSVRLAVESDTRGLFGLLDAVSRDSVVLVVDSLRIVVADPLVARGRPELLHSELTVRGLFLPESTSR